MVLVWLFGWRVVGGGVGGGGVWGVLCLGWLVGFFGGVLGAVGWCSWGGCGCRRWCGFGGFIVGVVVFGGWGWGVGVCGWGGG